MYSKGLREKDVNCYMVPGCPGSGASKPYCRTVLQSENCVIECGHALVKWGGCLKLLPAVGRREVSDIG
jgi:hypothetical protein